MAETENKNQAVPIVLQPEAVSPLLAVDPAVAGDTMRELGMSDTWIVTTTVYMDPRNRIQTFGTHYPKWAARFRFRSIPELRDAPGDVVRLSTVMKGKPRTAEEINKTFVHELEHTAQEERHDNKLTQGHIAIWGLAAAGAVLGRHRGKNAMTRTASTLIGGLAGHSIGYMIAPHERQARARAKHVKTHAVRERTD